MVEFEKVKDIAGRSIQSLYPPDKRHKGIVCPLCGNGQGKDGDGVTFVRGSNEILKCFRCGFSGDVIQLTAKANNISYREAAELLAEKLGLTGEKYQYDQKKPIEAFTVQKFEHAEEVVPEEKIDQTEYFKKVEKFLSQTDYPAKRGLSEETCRHFHIGYDAIWRHPKVPKAPISPRLIIPTSKYSYLARDVRENLSDDQKRYSKQKFGSVALFNPEALEYEFVFVTEGEIDAISFYEVCKVNALALGSVSNIQKLVDYLRTATSKPKFVIAALDNDQAGQEGNLKLKQALKEFDIETLIADFIYTDLDNDVQYKDANEILVKNRDTFIENIELLREIPMEYYSSDKPASKILEEIGMIEDDGDEFEPYSDEELSQLIKEPEFTEENLRSMFENENLTSEEMDILLSKDDSKTQEQDKLLERLKDEGDYRSFFRKESDRLLRQDLIPKLTEDIKKRFEEAKKYIDSVTEFPVNVLYSPKFMRAWAFCYMYDAEHYLKIFDRVSAYYNDDINLVNTQAWHDYTMYHAIAIIKEINAAEQDSVQKETLTVPPDETSPDISQEDVETTPAEENPTVAQTVSDLPVTPQEKLASPEVSETPSVSVEETLDSPVISQGKNVAISNEEISSSEPSVSVPSATPQEKARDLVNSITEFTQEKVFSSDVLQATAYCKIYFPIDFVNFVENCRTNKIKITLLKECLKQYVQPIAKEKRLEDKRQEKIRISEEAKKQHEAFEIARYNNSVKINSLLNQPQSPEHDQKIISLIKQSMERDRYGDVKSSSVTNFELALNCDPLIRGCIGYDTFSKRLVPRRKLPWTNELYSESQIAWSDFDDAGLQNYLNRTYGLNNHRIFFNVLSEYAKKNSFHPVKDYFKNLPRWDGIARAAEFFIENLEIEDSQYTREIIKSWMMAAVARVFHPGCKWDYTLIIKGVQGIGKSTVFSKLAGQWFNDSLCSVSGKETMENLVGSWIIELCEMQATRKADNEVIKSFLSRRVDRFRIPYSRRTEEFLRQCVFAATTNDEEFLKDHTGNRRFFVLVSKAQEEFSKKDLEKFGADYIKQIWAEVFFHYNQLFDNDKSFDSFKLLPSDEILKKAEEVRTEYTEGSALEGMIDAYLDIKLPEPSIWNEKNMMERRAYIQEYSPSSVPYEKTTLRHIVAAVEIAYELLQIDNPNKERATLKEISRILARKAGWVRTTWKNVGIYGRQRVAFQRQSKVA